MFLNFKEHNSSRVTLQNIDSKNLECILRRCCALKENRDLEAMSCIIHTILYKEKNKEEKLQQFLALNDYLELPPIAIENYISLDESINPNVLPLEENTLPLNVIMLCNKLAKAKRTNEKCTLSKAETHLLSDIIWNCKKAFNSLTAYSVLKEIKEHADFKKHLGSDITFIRLKYRNSLWQKWKKILGVGKSVSRITQGLAGLSLTLHVGKMIIWPSHIGSTIKQTAIPTGIYIGAGIVSTLSQMRIDSLRVKQVFFLNLESKQ